MSTTFRRRMNMVFPAMMALSLIIISKVDISNSDDKEALWFAVFGVLFNAYQMLMMDVYSEMFERRKMSFIEFNSQTSFRLFRRWKWRNFWIDIPFLLFVGGAILSPLVAIGFLLFQSHELMTYALAATVAFMLWLFNKQWDAIEGFETEFDDRQKDTAGNPPHEHSETTSSPEAHG